MLPSLCACGVIALIAQVFESCRIHRALERKRDAGCAACCHVCASVVHHDFL